MEADLAPMIEDEASMEEQFDLFDVFPIILWIWILYDFF